MAVDDRVREPAIGSFVTYRLEAPKAASIRDIVLPKDYKYAEMVLRPKLKGKGDEDFYLALRGRATAFIGDDDWSNACFSRATFEKYYPQLSERPDWVTSIMFLNSTVPEIKNGVLQTNPPVAAYSFTDSGTVERFLI